MNWQRAGKAEARAMVMDPAQGFARRQQHSAILLPGWDDASEQAGLCLRLGLETGSLDPSLPIILVERDPAVAAKIEANVRSLGLADVRMHVGELHDLMLDRPVDVAHIDLLGTLDDRTCRWLHDTLRPHLTQNARVAITVLASARGSLWMEGLCELIEAGDERFGPLLGIHECNLKEIAQSGAAIKPSLLTGAVIAAITALRFPQPHDVPFRYRRDETHARPMLLMRFDRFETMRLPLALDTLLEAVEQNRRFMVSIPKPTIFPDQPKGPVEGPDVFIGNARDGYHGIASTFFEYNHVKNQWLIRLSIKKGSICRLVRKHEADDDTVRGEKTALRRKQQSLVRERLLDKYGVVTEDLSPASPHGAGELILGRKSAPNRSSPRAADRLTCWTVIGDEKRRSIKQWMDDHLNQKKKDIAYA